MFLKFPFEKNWRDGWKKALSDSWSNVKFSLWLTNIHKENWKENLAVHEKSLGALFQAPLQLKNWQHLRELLLDSFHLVGHTIGLNPQTEKLEPAPCTAGLYLGCALVILQGCTLYFIETNNTLGSQTFWMDMLQEFMLRLGIKDPVWFKIQVNKNRVMTLENNLGSKSEVHCQILYFSKSCFKLFIFSLPEQLDFKRQGIFIPLQTALHYYIACGQSL